MSGSIDPAIDALVLSGPGGERITVEQIGQRDALVATYRSATGAEVEGDLVDWDGGDVDVEIISDPVGGGLGFGLAIRIDGQPTLRDFSSPDLAVMVPGDG